MGVCPGCGHDDAGAARFCSECGAALTAPPQEARKTVTVVFCDLVGSTALGERSDPEVLRSLMSRYHAELRRILEAHGGTVEKFVGDAAMAVFGIPHVHEDDAVRAVRAAVRMRDAVVPLGLQVRIGVNTGEVVTGTGETLVTDDAVNVAARLEQHAATGEILIGALTERLARAEVVTRPVEPLVVKGKSNPVPAFRVVATQHEATDHARGPFVGRADDLGTLESLVRLAADKRVPQLVTVVGEPGIGKSRLVAELLSRAQAQALVGRCLPYGDAITYWPLVEILEALGDLDAALGEGSNDVALVSVRLAAAGSAGAAASPDEIAWAFRRVVESVARERPLVVVFDDIQWAEPALLDLIEYVATFAQDVPLVLLCTARPELFDVRPEWAAPRPNSVPVRLEPLEMSEADALVARLGCDDDTRLRIVDAAEGNPLYLEQLVAMHQESPDRPLEIPPSLQALLAARIDRLEAEERRVVERASVEGRLFHRAAVVELLPETDRPQAGTRLIGLVRRELIRPDRAMFAGDDAFRFGHILIRDAAYDSIPKRVRAELHQRYVGWLLARLGDEAPSEILGYHLEQAHAFVRDLGGDHATIGDDAARHLEAAAQAARLRQDLTAVRKLLERAVGVATEPHLLGELLVALAEVCEDAGDFRAQEQALARAGEVASSVGDTRVERLALLSSWLLRLHIDPDGAADAATRDALAIIEATDPDDHRLLARAWSLLSETKLLVGTLDARLSGVDMAMEHARAAGDLALEIDLAQRWVPGIVFGSVPVDEGCRRLEDLTQRLGDVPAVQALVAHVLGHLHARRGDFHDAAQVLSTWRDHLRELGQEKHYAITASCVWDVMSLAGDYASGERALREGAEILERLGDRPYLSTLSASLGRAALLRGDVEEAERLLVRSRELGVADDVLNEAVWRAGLAQVRAVQGRLDEAVALAREAVEIIDRTDMLDSRGDCYLDLAEVLRGAGDERGATEAATSARLLYLEKGNEVSTARAVRFLEPSAPG